MPTTHERCKSGCKTPGILSKKDAKMQAFNLYWQTSEIQLDAGCNMADDEYDDGSDDVQIIVPSFNGDNDAKNFQTKPTNDDDEISQMDVQKYFSWKLNGENAVRRI